MNIATFNKLVGNNVQAAIQSVPDGDCTLPEIAGILDIHHRRVMDAWMLIATSQGASIVRSSILPPNPKPEGGA